MLDPGATLTREEILSRFKKLFNREMTREEKRAFFLDQVPSLPEMKLPTFRRLLILWVFPRRIKVARNTPLGRQDDSLRSFIALDWRGLNQCY
jgi:hypothetical protein